MPFTFFFGGGSSFDIYSLSFGQRKRPQVVLGFFKTSKQGVFYRPCRSPSDRPEGPFQEKDPPKQSLNEITLTQTKQNKNCSFGFDGPQT